MEEKQKLFRESTIKHISSPEQLNEYIRVTNPGVWLLLAALLVLLLGALIWGFLGEIKTTEPVKAIVQNGEAVFFCEGKEDFAVGMQAALNDGRSGTIASVSAQPVSRDEILAKYDEYTLFELDPPEWAYTVTLPLPDADDGICELTITTATVKPITFILN